MDEDLRRVIEPDRWIPELARLLIATKLTTAASADFLFQQRGTALTKGNLSADLSKWQDAGFIRIVEAYKGICP